MNIFIRGNFICLPCQHYCTSYIEGAQLEPWTAQLSDCTALNINPILDPTLLDYNLQLPVSLLRKSEFVKLNGKFELLPTKAHKGYKFQFYNSDKIKKISKKEITFCWKSFQRETWISIEGISEGCMCLKNWLIMNIKVILQNTHCKYICNQNLRYYASSIASSYFGPFVGDSKKPELWF